MNHPVKTSGTSIGALGAIPLSQPAVISEKAGIGTSATVGLKKAAPVDGYRAGAACIRKCRRPLLMRWLPNRCRATRRPTPSERLRLRRQPLTAEKSSQAQGPCRGAVAAEALRSSRWKPTASLVSAQPRGEGGQGCGRPGAQGCARGWCRDGCCAGEGCRRPPPMRARPRAAMLPTALPVLPVPTTPVLPRGLLSKCFGRGPRRRMCGRRGPLEGKRGVLNECKRKDKRGRAAEGSRSRSHGRVRCGEGRLR